MVKYMAAPQIPSPDDFRKMLDLPANPESVLRDVLARDEFRDSAIQSLLDRLHEMLIHIMTSVLSWIAKHWPTFGPLPENIDFFWTFLGIAFYGIISGLVITAIVLLFHRVILPRFAQKRSRVSEHRPESEDLPPLQTPSREAALALARQGHCQDALMVLFRCVLTQLQEQGLVKLHPSCTNRDILDQVSATQLIKVPLSQMAIQFNAVRYGKASCNKSDFDHFLGLAEQVTRGS